MARKTAERSARVSRAARPARARPSRGVPRRWLALGALAVLLGAVATAFYLLVGRGEQAPPDAIAVLKTNDFHALAFSPTDPNVVFFGHHNGIMRSDDGGRTWRPLVERPNFDAMALAVSRANPRQLYLAGHDVFQVSADGGASWRPVQHNLPGTDIHAFAMSPDDPNRLYAFVVGHGVLQSADGGRTWRRLPSQPPGGVAALLAAGGTPETIYAGTTGSGAVRSTDGGQTWVQAGDELRSRAIAALAIDPSARQTLYAGINGGLFKSSDGAATWARLPFPGENAIALAVSPARPSIVLAITFKDGRGLVYRSEDGGRTWGGTR